MQDYRLEQSVTNRLLEDLKCVLTGAEIGSLLHYLPGMLAAASASLLSDLKAYTERDPASHGNEEVIVASYASFHAVAFYRLAHQIWITEDSASQAFHMIAHKLSNQGKALSGIDIHPAAKIGRRFVLDHGFGTVIGETCEIGDNCYVLNGVILGATGIGNNQTGIRHPRVGHNVQIGTGARILGPITIGDDTFISPACIVTQDIPAHTRVCIVNQLQIERSNSIPCKIRLGAFTICNELHIIGEHANQYQIAITDMNHECLPCIVADLINGESHYLRYRLRIPQEPTHSTELHYPVHLRFSNAHHQFVLMNPPGLTELVQQTLSRNPLPMSLS